ncbi:MAG TPA: response regulator [Candidatus Hydrogenedentes bacterium]|nr:response regulator [Candidatus Hydrogenedentota bacterium]
MPRNTPRGGIERKILTSILWVGILPVALVLLVGLNAVRYAQRMAVETALASAAQRTADGVLLACEPLLNGARMLAAHPAVAAALQADGALPLLHSHLQEEVSYFRDGLSVFSVFDRAGTLVASSNEDEERQFPYSVQDDKVTDAEFVNIYYDAAEGAYLARIAAPVTDPEARRLLGFASELTDITHLFMYALGHPPEGDRAAHPDPNADVYQAVYRDTESTAQVLYFERDAAGGAKAATRQASSALVAALASPESPGYGTLRLRDYETPNGALDVLLAYHRMQEDLFLIAYRPTRVVYTNINIAAGVAVLGCLLLIMFLCVFAYRNVHNNIVQHISLLNEGAQIIRQGDLELKLKIHTGDEIEELATSFNKMALALKRNIQQLEESEEKYRSLVTSMRDGIYQTDPQGMITFMNPAGLGVFGYRDTEEAVGRNLRELFVEEIDYARIRSEMAAKGFVERSRIWMKRKDGRAICVELSGNRVYDDANVFAGTEGTFRDVTTSVRLEHEARERSERISAINMIANVINSSLEAGRLYESLVVEIRKLVDFDYAALALLERESEGFDTRQLWPEREVSLGSNYRLDGKNSCAAWVAAERKCLIVDDLDETGSPFRNEYPDYTKSFVCVPLYATGRIIGTLNLGSSLPAAFSRHDVEVLEQVAPHVAVAIRNAQLLDNLHVSLEEVTRAREKLHEAIEELKTLDEMKTNLLSNVSHELRTPLVSVMGYTDMIYNGKVGPINDIQKEYLEISMRNIEKLVTLIENLLDFSRLHRGAEKMVFTTFDLTECANSCMRSIQPVADGRRIALKLVAPDEPVLVDGDKGKMGQVFNNLLSNAVKFNKNGGAVTVELREADETVEVSVSDTGIGIPPEALDKVFTRFYQYDSSSTLKYGGTGIGLSIAQDIVRLHGGRITVTSRVGKSSTFRFSLPIRRPARKTTAPALPQEAPAFTETRLLVELVTQDSALSAQVRELLVSEGMDVIHAANAAHAAALAQKHRPDCILVDADSGDKAAHTLDALLADKWAGELPIIIITNDDEVYTRYHSFVASRLKRSFRKSSLLGRIHYALSQGLTGEEPLGEKILCVDDDPEVLAFMQRCLQTEGLHVECCESGEEALERAATREYGLMLLDIAMPGLDGWEVCRAIKSDISMAAMKVYMVTAKPVDGSMSRLQEAGPDGFLMKPFRPEELSELVRGVEVIRTAKDP